MQSPFNNPINPKLLGKCSVQHFIMVISLLSYCSLYGQRLSIGVAEFGSVVVGEGIPIFFLEDTAPMVVFDGFPLEQIGAETLEGVLVIRVPERTRKEKGTVVVRYSAGKGRPLKALIPSDRCADIGLPKSVKL